ncbi:MAG: hypothetical protein GYB67_15795 [Chloroflexi bacterium]|nr:hypothetical protein [Chloroflexota bacterium]
MGKKNYIIIGVSLALLVLLVGCGPGTAAFGGLRSEAEAIDSATVIRTVRYFDEGALGPEYAFSVTVPEEWVGQFETSNNGHVVTFNFITERDRRAPIFTIQALSFQQFWEQNGSYPSGFYNLAATPDTYFIYTSSLDAYHSGLPAEQYAELRAPVAEIITTFDAVDADEALSLMAAN